MEEAKNDYRCNWRQIDYHFSNLKKNLDGWWFLYSKQGTPGTVEFYDDEFSWFDVKTLQYLSRYAEDAFALDRYDVVENQITWYQEQFQQALDDHVIPEDGVQQFLSKISRMKSMIDQEMDSRGFIKGYVPDQSFEAFLEQFVETTDYAIRSLFTAELFSLVIKTVKDKKGQLTGQISATRDKISAQANEINAAMDKLNQLEALQESASSSKKELDDELKVKINEFS